MMPRPIREGRPTRFWSASVPAYVSVARSTPWPRPCPASQASLPRWHPRRREREGGRRQHNFPLNFPNTPASTIASLARDRARDTWYIGFNLSRKFY
jgi:hypothetical protein